MAPVNQLPNVDWFPSSPARRMTSDRAVSRRTKVGPGDRSAAGVPPGLGRLMPLGRADIASRRRTVAGATSGVALPIRAVPDRTAAAWSDPVGTPAPVGTVRAGTVRAGRVAGACDH